METVDMSRFVLSGAGANGESYDSLDDKNVMLKLYNASYPKQPVIDELEIARKAFEIGVPSPEPGELVEVDGRLGIKFRRVIGKRSFSRALADEPERVEEYAREFARNGKLLHSIHCPEGLVPNQKAIYLGLLEKDKAFGEEDKAKMRRFLEAMPDCDTAVHGDFHMGNILTTLPKGAPITEPHDVLYIDIGYFAAGCPLLDIGMLDCICHYLTDEFREREMHIGADIAAKFWDYFVDEYFFGPEKLGEKWFGAGITPDAIADKILPYTAVKMLLVEYNAGFMPPEYVELINKALNQMR